MMVIRQRVKAVGNVLTPVSDLFQSSIISIWKQESDEMSSRPDHAIPNIELFFHLRSSFRTVMPYKAKKNVLYEIFLLELWGYPR